MDRSTTTAKLMNYRNLIAAIAAVKSQNGLDAARKNAERMIATGRETPTADLK